MKNPAPKRLAVLMASMGLTAAVAAALPGAALAAEAPAAAPDIAPLPESKPGKEAMVEMGKYLFFDNRLSGDWGVSCASCHDPAKGWGDGQALSQGYPGSEYFRNAPTLLNATYKKAFMWDGRLAGNDMGTLVRDMVTEAHTMNADGRIVQERLKQVPEYVAMWEKAFGHGKDPYGPSMFNVVGEFVKTLTSQNAPIDKYLKGDESALSAEAKEGLALFRGKAGCVACHNGPILSDGKRHRLGVPEHPDVLGKPLRTITMLRHYATSGMPNYMNARSDVGFYAISKDPADLGKFATPSLRELKYTAPYMHNGVLATLPEVVDFYDKGGGQGSALKPLNLSDAEKKSLIAFLDSLSGDPVSIKAPESPAFKLREFGKN
jgi:cytochrome c peroxidase